MQLESLEPRQLLAVVISEFMADNESTIQDEDGDFSFSEILDGTDPADPASGGVGMPVAPSSNYSLILLLAAAALLGLGAFASVRIRRET